MTSGITVNLDLNSASGTGIVDSITGIENIIGSTADDLIVGNTGNNSILAGDGNDTVGGGAGDNTLDGGAGVNTLTYETLTSSVFVDLSAASAASALGTDSFTGFINVIGSTAGDSIIGDDKP